MELASGLRKAWGRPRGAVGEARGGSRGPQLSCCGWQGQRPGLAGLPGVLGQSGPQLSKGGYGTVAAVRIEPALQFCSQLIFFIDLGIRKEICLVPPFMSSSGVDFIFPGFPIFPFLFFPLHSPVPSSWMFFLGHLLFSLSKKKHCLSVPCFVTADPACAIKKLQCPCLALS